MIYFLAGVGLGLALGIGVYNVGRFLAWRRSLGPKLPEL
jgi:hypothetical protein